MITRIASDEILEQAFDWLGQARKDYSANADIWHLKHHWRHRKPAIQQALRAGHYHFSPLNRYEIDGDTLCLWSAEDALVLKALAIVLSEEIAPQLSRRCYHAAGLGGLKAAVRDTDLMASEYTFVFKSDINSYYASIQHDTLLAELDQLIADKAVVRLIAQSLQRVETRGGLFWEFNVGIPMGSPLSPLLGAIALLPLDRALTQQGLYYARFMDDWVVLTKTRHQLRKMIKVSHQVLTTLKMKMHPDKTFIGRISKGFDFLGYHFNGKTLQVAAQTIGRFTIKLAALYEQNAKKTTKQVLEYMNRWLGWLKGGLNNLIYPAELECLWRKEGDAGEDLINKILTSNLCYSTSAP